MEIVLPEFFHEKLLPNQQINGCVQSALHTFGQWFGTSGTPFFRDYTDHGPQHSSNVLATAVATMTTESKELFTSADAALLVFATLLHDSALHLAEPGFERLIRGEARERRIEVFDTQSWPALWSDFMFTASRWDDNKRSAVFGSDFVSQGRRITDPFERWGDLNETDRKLIGEFIRSHHPRLAHEFAVFGVPGVNSTSITLPSELSDKLRDLSGVIARSHGLPIRACLDYVGSRFHKRDFQGVHSVYLMTLLRISDYLQIEASRAPEIVLKYRRILSRTSQLEWKAHHAVKNITPENEDPESIDIRAEPADVETYLRLREWLDGLQAELDSSWAVIGEVYGSSETLCCLGLRWRRVRSNLDDRVAFAKTVSFLPRRIRIEVARAEMLSLLIRPLYGDDPSYGIRELIQNSVDAVREREFFQTKSELHRDVALREQDADVVVWVDDYDEKQECSWLEISDRGIGMTEKVLIDYFLTAGASFRHSEQWQRTFESSDPKAKTKSHVLRSGRFGVGALAAFLLGDWMEVETRHAASETGIRFSMNLTDDAVQVERVEGLPVGTRIRVRVTKSAYEKLDRGQSRTRPAAWDWYVLRQPSVRRVFGKLRIPKNQRYTHDWDSWRLLEADLAYAVHWSFDTAHSLAANGIFVSNSGRLPSLENYKWEKSEVGVFMPNLHISDADGHLPLGLTRKELLADDYGFETELYESVMKDFIAWLLVYFPEQPTGVDLFSMQFHPAVGRHWEYSSGLRRPRIDWLLSADGFALPFETMFENRAPVRRLLVLSGEDALQRLGDIDHWDCIVIQGGLVFHSFRFSCPGDEIVAELFCDERKLAWKQTVAEFQAAVAHNEEVFSKPAEEFT